MNVLILLLSLYVAGGLALLAYLTRHGFWLDEDFEHWPRRILVGGAVLLVLIWPYILARSVSAIVRRMLP